MAAPAFRQRRRGRLGRGQGPAQQLALALVPARCLAVALVQLQAMCHPTPGTVRVVLKRVAGRHVDYST